MANERLIFLACNIYSILAEYSLHSCTFRWALRPMGLWFSFLSDLLLQSYVPFSMFFFFDFPIVSLWNLVNKISQEPTEQGSWYLAHRLCLRCRWSDLTNYLNYLSFPTCCFVWKSNLVNKISGEPLELGSRYQAYSLHTWCRSPDLFP